MISIHAPARGATRKSAHFRKTWQFQSTLPRGERLSYPSAMVKALQISIHAPARGATPCRQRSALSTYFNPRSREGSDRNARKIHRKLRHFNPRSREGSDNMDDVSFEVFLHFNPRSREGSDFFSYHLSEAQRGFQSTLPRGERLQFYLKFTLCF